MKVKKLFKENNGLWFLILLLIIVLIFSLIPLINTFIDSFKVYERYSKVNFNWGVENFYSVLSDNDFHSALTNSSVIMLIATPLGILIAFLFSLLVNGIFLKLFKNVVITLLYSQFFISIFAIGSSFIFLFGDEKDVFNKVFGTNIAFVRNNPYIIYTIFQLWRIIPFNTVLFVFAITQATKKNWKKIKMDNLSLKDKLFNIYLYEIKKSFLLIIYINFITSIMLYPRAILGQDFNLSLYKFHTLASYIYDFINPPIGGSSIKTAEAGVASILIFSYIFGIFIISQILKYGIKITLKQVGVYKIKKRGYA
ncbi:hypothetical protein ACW95P_02075 [Candidatus Mycoplasma pogonae]